MNGCRLNIDVLLVVLSFADRSTSSSLIQASRILYQLGAKFLLRGGVYLSSDQSLCSFLSFMRTNLRPDDLPRSLRALELSMHTISPATGDALQQLFIDLGDSGTLRTLSVTHAEAVLASHEGLAAAVARLTTLKDLSLRASGTRCAELLRNLRSRLVTATIAFDDQDEEWVQGVNRTSTPYTHDPFGLFVHSRDTLTTLDIANPGPVSDNIPVYPALRVLEFESSAPPMVEHILRAFPGLKVIHISGDSGGPFIWFDHGLTRTLNIVYQVAQGSWPMLDNVGASAKVLWILGLQCPVRWLNITLTDDRELDVLADVLSDSRPLKVNLVIYGAAKLMDERCVAALCSPRVPSIKTLHLHVRLGNRDADLDIIVLLNAVGRIARTLRLTSLKLVLDCGDLAPKDVQIPGGDDPTSSNGVVWRSLHPIEVSLAMLPLDEAARRIQAAVPTLFTTQIQLRQHFIRGDEAASASSRGPLAALGWQE